MNPKFEDVPRRIFLDSSALQALQNYGGFRYEPLRISRRLQTVALYPICWLYNHVPGADFADLVDAPIRILAGSEDDHDGGPGACEALWHNLVPRDAAHISLRVCSGATHPFDTFDGGREYNDPGANRRRGGLVRVRPDVPSEP